MDYYIKKKKCTCCEKKLPIWEFYDSKRYRDGKDYYCIKCRNYHTSSYKAFKKKSNPALYLLGESCRSAIERGKPGYLRSGYEHVACSYSSAKSFVYDLWDNDKFRTDWITQTNIYLASGNKRDRPTLDRIDPKKGYEKDNIRCLAWWQNVSEGASKSCHVFVIAATRILEVIVFSSLNEAKKAIVSKFKTPKNIMKNVDHGTIIECADGISLLIQTQYGKLKEGVEDKYRMVVTKKLIYYDLETGEEFTMAEKQLETLVSGIRLESVV